MPFLIVIGGVLVLAAVFGPSLWAKSVLKRYSHARADFPGTGGELARHLLDEMGMEAVKAEYADDGDHYSPIDKAVRLSPDNFDGASLTAVVVAAHEVGHAIQDRDGYGPMKLRTRLAGPVATIERLGAIAMFAAPVLGLITRSPGLGLLAVAAGILSMASAVVFHLVTLPVEYDASFRRALPVLQQGGYLSPGDMPAARRILKACTLTYVAASLASLLNFFRWLRMIR